MLYNLLVYIELKTRYFDKTNNNGYARIADQTRNSFNEFKKRKFKLHILPILENLLHFFISFYVFSFIFNIQYMYTYIFFCKKLSLFSYFY